MGKHVGWGVPKWGRGPVRTRLYQAEWVNSAIPFLCILFRFLLFSLKKTLIDLITCKARSDGFSRMTFDTMRTRPTPIFTLGLEISNLWPPVLCPYWTWDLVASANMCQHSHSVGYSNSQVCVLSCKGNLSAQDFSPCELKCKRSYFIKTD